SAGGPAGGPGSQGPRRGGPHRAPGGGQAAAPAHGGGPGARRPPRRGGPRRGGPPPARPPQRGRGGVTSRTLKVGTRGGHRATTQAGHVRDALIAAGYPAELVIVRTRGDVVMAPVERIGVGVFTMELRAALERCDCDVAVHSYKDLPTARDERFAPIAVPPRVA